MCFVRYKLSVLTISSYRVVVFLRRCVVYVLFITYVWYVVEDGCTLGGRCIRCCCEWLEFCWLVAFDCMEDDWRWIVACVWNCGGLIRWCGVLGTVWRKGYVFVGCSLVSVESLE